MGSDISSAKNGVVVTVNHQLNVLADWRQELIQYLAEPLVQANFKLKQKALKYVLIDGELFRRGQERMLLKCLNKEEAMKVMGEVHEGVCGAHKSGSNMK